MAAPPRTPASTMTSASGSAITRTAAIARSVSPSHRSQESWSSRFGRPRVSLPWLPPAYNASRGGSRSVTLARRPDTAHRSRLATNRRNSRSTSASLVRKSTHCPVRVGVECVSQLGFGKRELLGPYLPGPVWAEQKRPLHLTSSPPASFDCRSAAAPSMPPMPIDSTAVLGTSINAPFSFNPSYSMFIARRCSAVGLSW